MRSMKIKRYLTIMLLATLMFTPTVYASDDDTVNILDIPKHLAKALGVNEYAGKLLASVFLFMILIFPVIIFSRDKFVLLFMGTLVLGTCVAIGWLEVWYMLLILLVVAGLWSAKMRGWLT